MKAMIATGVGVLALGGLLLANSGRSASAQSSLAGPAFVNQADANRTTLVNCGEGRQALVFTDPRTGQSQVQCVGAEAGLTAQKSAVPLLLWWMMGTPSRASIIALQAPHRFRRR